MQSCSAIYKLALFINLLQSQQAFAFLKERADWLQIANNCVMKINSYNSGASFFEIDIRIKAWSALFYFMVLNNL